MRENNLVFEGHNDSERRAAGIIQRSILYAIKRYKMDIRQFQNRQKTENTKLDIPDFMKKQPT